MGWSTDLFCNISFNKETFNSKSQVTDRLDEVNEDIIKCENELRNLALMTEPNKFTDSDPYEFVTDILENNLDELKMCAVEKWKLSLLLENWDDCHDKETGLAKYPPEICDQSYLCGDYVKSDKYPDGE